MKAVRGMNFEVGKGETVAIVGESGSGKSVTAQTIMRLIPSPPSVIKKGEVIFQGQDLCIYPVRVCSAIKMEIHFSIK